MAITVKDLRTALCNVSSDAIVYINGKDIASIKVGTYEGGYTDVSLTDQDDDE